MLSQGVGVKGGRCHCWGWPPKEMLSQEVAVKGDAITGGVKIDGRDKGGVRVGRWEVKISLRI